MSLDIHTVQLSINQSEYSSKREMPSSLIVHERHTVRHTISRSHHDAPHEVLVEEHLAGG